MREDLLKSVQEKLNLKEEVTMDSNLKDDLGIDSMDAVSLVVQLEEELEIEIPDEELANFVTVGNIIDYIEKVSK